MATTRLMPLHNRKDRTTINSISNIIDYVENPAKQAVASSLPAFCEGRVADAELVNNMLEKTLATLRPGEHPIIQSDRGCHYRRPDWIKRIDDAGLTRSMSRKGCSPDNSACKEFFGRLKTRCSMVGHGLV